MRSIALTLLFIALLATGLQAMDLGKVVACPVPFNPKKGDLSLKDNSSSPITVPSLTFEVFDINGDLVVRRKYSGLNLTSAIYVWNGRNGAGKIVKPGFYIIKITAEDSTGDYAKKIIRILVDY